MTRARLITEITTKCPEIEIELHHNAKKWYIFRIFDPILGIDESFNTQNQPKAKELLEFIYSQIGE